MNVVHVNTRLYEGGAAQLALELSHNLNQMGCDSSIAYGYAKGVASDPRADTIGAVRVGHKPFVYTNYGFHKLVGISPFSAVQALNRVIDDADIIHVHNLHHYYINPISFTRSLARRKAHVVMTLHDWWWITGRCSLAYSCLKWRDGCGGCPPGDPDLPALVDISRMQARSKRRALNALPGVRVVAPSQHLLADFQAIYPDITATHIPNSTTHSHVEANQFALPATLRGSLEGAALVIAHDLSAEWKTDRIAVSAFQRASGLRIVTIGGNSPFLGTEFLNLGFVADPAYLMACVRAAKCLLFTSRRDNNPLTVMEALCQGTPVVALDSPAAAEVLARVRGRTITLDDLPSCASPGFEWKLYDGLTKQSLESTAKEEFASATMTERYLAVYRSFSN